MTPRAKRCGHEKRSPPGNRTGGGGLRLTRAGAVARRRAPLGNVKATREDWLDLALSVLAAEGVAHVTVLNLSERLERVAVELLLVLQESR